MNSNLQSDKILANSYERCSLFLFKKMQIILREYLQPDKNVKYIQTFLLFLLYHNISILLQN